MMNFGDVLLLECRVELWINQQMTSEIDCCDVINGWSK